MTVSRREKLARRRLQNLSGRYLPSKREPGVFELLWRGIGRLMGWSER